MAWPKLFTGAAATDIDAAGIGASKVTGAGGAFRLSGYGRAFTAIASQTTFYQFSDTLTDKNYRLPWSFFVDSTTLEERFGVFVRDTSTNATTGRNGVLFRLRTQANTSAFLEIFRVIDGGFGTAVASVGLTIAPNTPYSYVIEAENDQFTLYAADGVTPVVGPVTISDAVLQNAGKIGLYSSSQGVAATGGASDQAGTGTHIVSLDFEYINNDVVATGTPASVTVTAPTGAASADGAPVEATGSPPQASVTAPTGSASSGLPLALLWDFDGSNASSASTVISNAETTTPTVDLALRNPEGGTPLWQHFLFGLQNPDAVAKTATINVDLTNKDGGNGILSTWSGPYKASTLTDHTAWEAVARSAAAGVLTFTIVVPGNSSVYVASMPPNTQAQIESRIAAFAAAYPSLIHDDLPSRIAEGGAAYVVDIAPTVADDLGRTFTNRPMFGFRIGNDAVGTPKQKRRVLFFANRHPGEHHGNFQLWGALQEWASSTDPLIVAARDEIELWVYPQHAVNGIAAGYRRHEPRIGYAPGDDINREWKTNSGNHIAVQWINVLTTDHGAGYDRVEAVIDFHDLAYSTQLIVYYYRAETLNLAALRAVIDAEFTSELPLETTNTDTATDYFVNTVGTIAFTAEVSDEAASLAGFEAVGAGWARIVSKWNDAELIGTDPVEASGTPAGVTVTVPTGAASADGAPVEATGAPSGVGITAPSGSASASGEASGSPSGVNVTAPEGSASAGPAPTEASGEPAAVTVSAPTGAISAGATATGTPADVSMSAPAGFASGTEEEMPPIDMRFILSLKKERTTFMA